MQITLIENKDDSQRVPYKIARIIYAETLAHSLPVVEAMASVIYNIHMKFDKSFEDIINDNTVFDVLDKNSPRHEYINVSANDRKFQMCLRVVQKMIRGNLKDSVFGATKFHHANVLPQWAVARGYIAEIDDMLFYL